MIYSPKNLAFITWKKEHRRHVRLIYETHSLRNIWIEGIKQHWLSSILSHNLEKVKIIIIIITVHLNQAFNHLLHGNLNAEKPLKPDLLVSIRTEACGLVVFGAVDVGAIVESSVSSSDGSPPTLVEKMPVEARKGSVLRALVLEEQRALLCPELLQVSKMTKTVKMALSELGDKSKA